MSAKNQKLNLDEATLYDMYVIRQMSTPQIAKEFNCSARCVQNYLKKYSIQARSFSEASVISMNNRTEAVLKQRAGKFRKTWNSHPKEERERINKSRATKPENKDASVRKAKLTKMKRCTGTKSKAEDCFYESLKISFDDVIRQYTDERYPFNCDFYIPSQDLFIEYQGHPTHGFEPYDSNNLKHQEILAKSTLNMTTWTKRDVEKLEVAKKNNINLILVYPKHTNYLLKNGKLTALEINDLWKI